LEDSLFSAVVLLSQHKKQYDQQDLISSPRPVLVPFYNRCAGISNPWRISKYL